MFSFFMHTHTRSLISMPFLCAYTFKAFIIPSVKNYFYRTTVNFHCIYIYHSFIFRCQIYIHTRLFSLPTLDVINRDPNKNPKTKQASYLRSFSLSRIFSKTSLIMPLSSSQTHTSITHTHTHIHPLIYAWVKSRARDNGNLWARLCSLSLSQCALSTRSGDSL